MSFGSFDIKLHPGQLKVFGDPHRFRVLCAGRRFGKTVLARTELISWAKKKDQLIWYVAPTYRMARQILWHEIIDVLPRKWVKSLNNTRLEIELVNGSRIELKGADKPDTLRGVGINFIVLDEAQDIKPDTWYKVLRPTLSSTLGSALFIGCVKNDTLILPRDGMRTIEGFSQGSPDKTLDDIDLSLYGIDRTFHKADGFWNNGVVQTKRIVSQNGFELEASLPHPVLVMSSEGKYEWRRMQDLQTGDRIAIERGMNVWGNKNPLEGWKDHCERWIKEQPHSASHKPISVEEIDLDFAYFLGLWIAEGSVELKTHRVSITCGDNIGDFLTSGRVLGHEFKPSSGRNDQWRINSKVFVELLRYLQMPLVKAPFKTLPAWLFSAKPEIVAAFVAGMWDGDGHCTGKCLGYTSASKPLVQQLQLLLSNFGIISRLTSIVTPPTERVKVPSLGHRLTVGGKNVGVFRSNITLRIPRKQAKLEAIDVCEYSRRDGVPFLGELLRRVRNSMRRLDRDKKCPKAVFQAALETDSDLTYRSLKMFVDSHQGTRDTEALQILTRHLGNNYYWDEIVSIVDSNALTYDFTIPDTHSFWSNGFISHNTPKSFNWFYDLYMMGQRGEMVRTRKGKTFKNTWASWQFPTIMSPFIPNSEIAAARQDLDEKTYRQEYLASFEAMSGRVYYGFDRNIHLGDYELNPNLPIWVGQDFNIDPMSSVIMQYVDNKIYVFDELIMYGSNTQETAEELSRRYWRHLNKIVFYPDPAGANRSHTRGESDLDILRDAGFRRMKYRRKHPKVADRVNAVNRMLQSADGQVRLFVDRRCKNLIDALEQTIYKPNSREVDKSMGIEHPADALGYGVELEFPVRKVRVAGTSI